MDGLGVIRHHVEDARYYKGKNPEEAQVVATAVIEHLVKHPRKSLGVGTVNVEQRDLILDLLDRAMKEDRVARDVVDDMQAGTEPFFVKNLDACPGLPILPQLAPQGSPAVLHRERRMAGEENGEPCFDLRS